MKSLEVVRPILTFSVAAFFTPLLRLPKEFLIQMARVNLQFQFFVSKICDSNRSNLKKYKLTAQAVESLQKAEK